MAACQDQVSQLSPPSLSSNQTEQVNAVSVTSSNFPNRETFVEREEFCILLEKLIRTCKSKGKYYVLSKFYPNLCHLLWNIRNFTDSRNTQHMLCYHMKWSPRKMGFEDEDPR